MRFKENIPRIKLFGRFMQIYDPLDKENFKFYLLCLNYTLNISTYGYLVPTNETEEVHYSPLIRVNDFIRIYFE